MKEASKAIYTIGFIFNIVGLIFIALFIASLAVSLSSNEIIAKLVEQLGRGELFIRNWITLSIIVLAVVFAIDVAALVLILRARKDLNEGTGKVGTHLVLLLIGVFGFNLFYLLGGIFGIVASNQDSQLDD